jgi:hypothetical protein
MDNESEPQSPAPTTSEPTTSEPKPDPQPDLPNPMAYQIRAGKLDQVKTPE